MILHLEFKLVFSHFVYIGTHGTFQVSSWKSVFVFRLWNFNEDEVHEVGWGFCLPFVYIFLFRICHFVFIEAHGTFKTPSEKIAFVKVHWKVSNAVSIIGELFDLMVPV